MSRGPFGPPGTGATRFAPCRAWVMRGAFGLVCRAGCFLVRSKSTANRRVRARGLQGSSENWACCRPGPLTERSLNGLLVGVLLQSIMASRLDVVANADPPRFTVTDLGPYEATFVSNDGQILGNDYSGPWLWRNGARVVLNGNGLNKISFVGAVNRSGHVAGALLAG